MDLSHHLPALQVVVPLLLEPVVLLLQPRGLAWLAATATSALATAIAVALALAVLGGADVRYAMGGWAAPYGIELAVDAFSAMLLLVVTVASTVALLACRDTLEADISAERQPYFYAAWLLELAGLCGILVSADAFNIFVFMEISSLASYVIIAGGGERRALPAVFKYLVMGTIGATFYLIGVGLLYLMTGTLNLADMAVRLQDVAALAPVLLAAGFITVGLALKAAVFPMHAWLPNAYTFAPHAVTVFLAACATKVMLYLLLRIDFQLFQGNLAQHDLQFTSFLLPLALLAIVLASGAAVFERNLKRLFAYSSVAQIGYIVLGASLLTAAGLTASTVHMFNHAIAKGAAFLAIACLATRLPALRLDNLGGVARQMPWTMGALVVAGLSLIGVPGTVGFISKWTLVSAALAEGTLGWWLIGTIVLGSLLALVYVWRVVEAAYFADAEPGSDLREAPLPVLLVAWLAAGGCLYFGLFPQVPLDFAARTASLLLGYGA